MDDTDIIHKPNYRFESLDKLIQQYEQGKSIVPDASVFSLSECSNLHYYDISGRFQLYRENLSSLQNTKYQQFFDLSFYQSQSILNHTLSLNKRLQDFNRDQFDEIPIYEYSSRDLSLNQAHLEQMCKNDRWIIQLISFFHALTKNRITVIIDDLSYDSFIFNNNGTFASFISYELLDIHPNLSEVKITEMNLRGFAKLILLFFQFSAGIESNNVLITNHDSLFNKLLHRIKSDTEIGFHSFNDIANYLKDAKSIMKPKRFGVFLDIANIYTGIKTMKIDYQSLVLSVFGLEAKGRIKEENKHAVLFFPVYEDEGKTSDVHSKQKKMGLCQML